MKHVFMTSLHVSMISSTIWTTNSNTNPLYIFKEHHDHQADPYLDLIVPIEEPTLKIPKAWQMSKDGKWDTTREIKTSKTKHFKGRKISLHIITEWWKHHNPTCRQRQCY